MDDEARQTLVAQALEIDRGRANGRWPRTRSARRASRRPSARACCRCCSASWVLDRARRLSSRSCRSCPPGSQSAHDRRSGRHELAKAGRFSVRYGEDVIAYALRFAAAAPAVEVAIHVEASGASWSMRRWAPRRPPWRRPSRSAPRGLRGMWRRPGPGWNMFATATTPAVRPCTTSGAATGCGSRWILGSGVLPAARRLSGGHRPAP